MPASGALGPFLDAMMKLRAQRLDEQEFKAKQQADAMSSMGQGIAGGISSLGSSLGDAMKAKQDFDLGNKLGPGGTATPWQGGGTRELELRKGMGQYESQKPLSLYQEQELGYRRLAENRAIEADKLSKERYEDTVRRQTSEETNKAKADALSLMQDRDEAMDDLRKATTKEDYDIMLRRVQAYHVAAKNRNLQIPEVQAPPFYTPSEKKSIEAYDVSRNQAAQEGYTTKGWGGKPVESEAGRAEREGRWTLPSTFGQPGPTIPGYEPPPQAQQQPSSAAPSSGGGRYNMGERRTWPDGTTHIYLGPQRGWVQQ